MSRRDSITNIKNITDPELLNGSVYIYIKNKSEMKDFKSENEIGKSKYKKFKILIKTVIVKITLLWKCSPAV